MEKRICFHKCQGDFKISWFHRLTLLKRVLNALKIVRSQFNTSNCNNKCQILAFTFLQVKSICSFVFQNSWKRFIFLFLQFNGETVRGCPFVCRVSDTSRVSLTLRHLELIPVGQPAAFNIAVDRGGSAELTVTVRSKWFVSFTQSLPTYTYI